MRVAYWNFNEADQDLSNVAESRLIIAANEIAKEVRQACPVGTVSRPMYKTGPYKNCTWTARDAGQLKKSVRVTTKKNKWGREIWRRKNIRVYVGHYDAYYAAIVEFSHAFMRPALVRVLGSVKSIIGAK